MRAVFVTQVSFRDFSTFALHVYPACRKPKFGCSIPGCNFPQSLFKWIFEEFDGQFGELDGLACPVTICISSYDPSNR